MRNVLYGHLGQYHNQGRHVKAKLKPFAVPGTGRWALLISKDWPEDEENMVIPAHCLGRELAGAAGMRGHH